MFSGLLFANMGSSLVWAGALHLLFGNALIGIGEGLLIAIVFRQRPLICIFLMVIANYFSAVIGCALLATGIAKSLDLDLYNAWRWLWGIVAITYLLTVLLEWPFVAVCLCRTRRWFLNSLLGSLMAQSASYLVIFGWYWLASGVTLYTDMTIVQPSEIALPEHAVVYYIGESDGDVYAFDPARQESREVFELRARGANDWLRTERSKTQPDCWNVIAKQEMAYDKAVMTDLHCLAAEGPLRDGGGVPRIGAKNSSGWDLGCGWVDGMAGHNTRDDRYIFFSLQTPFVEWRVHKATQLPNGHVVFQLGKNQVCVLDPDTKRIALLARGRGPVVTLPNDTPGASEPEP